MKNKDERRQIGILYRDFLTRLIDLELLSARGELQNLLVQFAAMLIAFNFVVAVVHVQHFATSTLPHDQLLVALRGSEVFLISTTMAVAGLFAVLAWNNVLPDRRDSLVLGPLPVRTRTILIAKVAAVGTALGVSVVALNVFTGFYYPFVTSDPGMLGVMRSFAAYWLTMAAGGLFAYCSLLAVQGIAAQLLPYRTFLRVSSFLQLAAFFTILAGYFLAPPMASNSPSFWFLGLFQELNGQGGPVFGEAALRATWSLLIAIAITAGTFALAHRRNMRRIVEQPDIAPSDRSRPAGRLGRMAATRLFSRPLDRAIILFTARTIARSRQHRLFLAIYAGIGLAIALLYTRGLFYGNSGERWDHVDTPLLAASFVLLFFAMIGTRAIFAFPFALPANWIFRVTAVHSPAAYFAAVRKSVFALTALPIWIAGLVVFLVLWPGRPALEHLALAAAMGVLLINVLLYRFRKIPFACSYLPGKANLKFALGAYGIAFLFACDLGVRLELWTLERFARFAVLFSVVAAFAFHARRRTLEFAAAPHNGIQFEELPSNDAFVLDLRRDGSWSSEEAYVNAIETRGERTRLVSIAIGALILAVCGFVYQSIGEFHDHKRFPQIGRPVDIGGRSLNIYCSGEGSPTVILESGHSLPGYSWVLVQRDIAKFTRACWYDRAGMGWSDPGPHPNWSDSIARDLHKLLHAARVPPPYVMVGHSMGGFTVRVYHGLYPAEVAGVVLVDSSHEDTGSIMPVQTTPGYMLRLQELVMQSLGRIGLVRLAEWDPGPPPPGMKPREWDEISMLQWQLKSQVADVRERPLMASARQARAAGPLGDIPLIVLTAGMGMGEHQQAWITLQEGLTRLSTRGTQRVVGNSDHMIPFNAPEAVVDAVRDVVDEIHTSHTGTFSRVLP